MSPDIKIRRGVAAQAPPPYPARSCVTTPRTTNSRVRCWQQHAERRGFSIGADAASRFDAGSRTAARDIQARFGLTTLAVAGETLDGQVGQRTWQATVSWPPLPATVTVGVFADQIAEDVDIATNEMIADATGVNRVFVQAHNRGNSLIVIAAMNALLLVCLSDAAGTVPDLPNGYAARVRNLDTTGWLAPTPWRFADPASPFRLNAGGVTQRQPEVFDWNVDFGALGYSAGDHVLLLGLISATSTVVGASDNTLTAAERVVQTLVEGTGVNAGEPKVAARLVRLDAVTVIAPP